MIETGVDGKKWVERGRRGNIKKEKMDGRRDGGSKGDTEKK